MLVYRKPRAPGVVPSLHLWRHNTGPSAFYYIYCTIQLPWNLCDLYYVMHILHTQPLVTPFIITMCTLPPSPYPPSPSSLSPTTAETQTMEPSSSGQSNTTTVAVTIVVVGVLGLFIVGGVLITGKKRKVIRWVPHIVRTWVLSDVRYSLCLPVSAWGHIFSACKSVVSRYINDIWGVGGTVCLCPL